MSGWRGWEKIRFFDLDDDLWNTVLAVDLSAPFYLMREAYRFMPTDGTASIINLLSITAKTGTGAPHDSHFGPFIPSTVVYGAEHRHAQCAVQEGPHPAFPNPPRRRCSRHQGGSGEPAALTGRCELRLQAATYSLSSEPVGPASHRARSAVIQ